MEKELAQDQINVHVTVEFQVCCVTNLTALPKEIAVETDLAFLLSLANAFRDTLVMIAVFLIVLSKIIVLDKETVLTSMFAPVSVDSREKLVRKEIVLL